MRAFELRAYDGPGGLMAAEVAEPVAGNDELLVDVAAIGINFPDLLLTRGQYQLHPELPVVPGCEVAGTVRTAPAGSRWTVGDRVSAFVWTGGFAETVQVPVTNAAAVGDGTSFEVAAASIVNYQTVLFALDRRAHVRPGHRVLVLGAGGGIGTAAVQVALGLGAEVVAGVADEHQADVARAAGADRVFVVEHGYASRVRELLGGRGVDVVLDPVGDWLFDEAVRCLAPEGRVAVVGFAAGAIPSIAVNRLLLRNAGVIGAAFGAFLDQEPQLVAAQAARLADMAAAGFVRPQLDGVYPFAELPHHLDRLGRGEVRGKAVITVPQ